MSEQTKVSTKPGLPVADDDLVHIYCCDPNVSLCKLDITDATPVDTDDNECVMCGDIADNDGPCKECGEP